MKFTRCFNQPAASPRLNAITLLIGTLLLWLHTPMVLAQVTPIPLSGPPQSPLSPESNASRPQDFAQFSPYNNGFIELDLWRLEEKKFVRSRPVFSPNKQWMAYTEVIYMPNVRETTSKAYIAPLSELPPRGTFASSPSFYENRLDANGSLQQRIAIAGAGFQKANPFGFRTYTVVDWSATGRRLLLKEKNGVSHVGLKASDILIFDQEKGQTIRYPEIKRGIEYYWNNPASPTSMDGFSENTNPINPDSLNLKDSLNLDEAIWDIYPLGFEPGSDQFVLLKAWLFDKTKKRFLGIWRLDLDAERPELVSLQDQVVPVAANGTVGKVNLTGYPQPKKPKKRKKQKQKDGSPLKQ